MSKSLTFSLLCLLFIGMSLRATAQCTPDVAPPTPICTNNLEVTLPSNGGTATLLATEIDGGSTDNCTGTLQFNLEELPLNPPPTSATSLTFDASDIGQHEIALWVTDEAGNFDYCTVTVQVKDDCPNGSSPAMACNDFVTVVVLPNETLNVFPGIMLDGGPYCADYQLKLGANGAFQSYLTVDSDDIGQHQVTVKDLATNNTCWGILDIVGCTNDTEPPTAICNVEIDIQLTSNSPDSATLFSAQFDEGSFDNCAGQLGYFSELSPASNTPPTNTSMTFAAGQYYVVLWVIDEAGNTNQCVSELTVHPYCGAGSNPVLACNDDLTVSITPSETLSLDPPFFLEGGPYCSDYVLKLDNGSFENVLLIDTSEIGTHVYEVKDEVSGNSCWGTLNVVSDCGSDNEPPTAYCNNNLNLTYISGGIQLDAVDLNAGSYDNCPAPLQFFIEKGAASPAPPTTTSVVFDINEIGVNDVTMWVTDAAGISNYCTASVVVDTCVGTSMLACNDLVVLGVQGPQPAYLYPDDILEGGPYCLNQMVIGNALFGAPQPFMAFNASDAGTYTIQVTQVTTGNSCWGTVQVVVDCANDAVAPVAVCVQNMTIQASVDGPNSTFLPAAVLDAGSYDNCSSISFTIEQGSQPSATAPTAETLEFTAVGIYDDVFMWVTDEMGNANFCNVTVDVIPPKCTPDQTSPAIVAPADFTVSSDDLAAMNLDPQDFVQLNNLFGEAYAWDYCGLDTVLQSTTILNDFCGNLKTLTRYFNAIDDAGNSSTAEQTIHIMHDFSVNIPKDYMPGDPGDPEELTVLQGNGTSVQISYTDFIYEFNCDTIPDLIARKWDITDLCNFDLNLGPDILPRFDQDSDGIDGDDYTAWVTSDSVYVLENGLPVLTINENWNSSFRYKQFIRYNYDDTLQHSVAGTVFIDTLVNCTYDASEFGLGNWKVKAVGQSTGTVYTATTQANGLYEINFICVSDTVLELSLDVPFNYGQTCPTTWTVNTIPNQPAVQDIPVQLDDECPLMMVDLAAPFLRRCFANTYTVSYGNYSSQPIADAWVEVTLDSFMEYLTSSVPSISLGNNSYKFEVGTLAAGEMGSFHISFDLSCDADLGQTHCTEAHIFPDTLCPQNVNWSGANIEVEGNCVNDEVHLSIKNTGSGDMTAPLEFIVVEDVIMYMQNTFNLSAGQSYSLPVIPANGETWRLEAEQAPAHPYPGKVSVSLEGCNGLNMTGLVNLFPTEDPNPFIAVDCQANIGSFDPNDKTANPVGYGAGHFITRNTDIEYTIRFQNTGTDTAFTVVILDSLSQYLDPTTIRPGAGSHPFSFEEMDGVLRFTFVNIQLPSKDANEPASHGFVQFTAQQKPDMELGTVIENSAAIYFDFNEPVITNTVFHTIGENFIELSDANETNGLAPLKVFPNPASDAVTFSLPTVLGENVSFHLHDQLGNLVRSQPVSGDRFRFERKGMASGIYFYSIENDGIKLYSGKVILK